MNDPSPSALDRPHRLESTESSSGILRLGEIWRRPLDGFADLMTPIYCKSVLSLQRRRLLGIRGLEHIGLDRDPFIVVLNHSQRFEALVVPSLLMFHRWGHRIHFLADWPFLLMPLVSSFYRGAQVIVVAGKEPKIKALGFMQRHLVDPRPALERAAERLKAGAPVGIFPESTVNRNPRNLLRGSTGAARLALETGVPVVPGGIRFPLHEDPRSPIRDGEAMSIEIGEPLEPPRFEGEKPVLSEVRAFHRDIMQAIARLSGKDWSPEAPRRKSPCH